MSPARMCSFAVSTACMNCSRDTVEEGSPASPHGGAAEAWQPGQRDGLVRTEQVRQLLHGRATQRPRPAAFVQLALAAARDEHERRPAAEDRVAAPLLAALDALEQEAVRAVVDL